MPLTPEQINAFINQVMDLTLHQVIRATIRLEYRGADKSEWVGPTYEIVEEKIEPGKEVFLALPEICVMCEEKTVPLGMHLCEDCTRAVLNGD